MGENLLFFLVFGLSALMVPVWLVLEWRKKAIERAEWNEKMFREQVKENSEQETSDDEL